MNIYRKMVWLLWLLIIPPSQSRAQWGASGCGPVGLPALMSTGFLAPPLEPTNPLGLGTSQAKVNEWRQRADRPDEAYLMDRDRYLGAWIYSEKKFRYWLGDHWGEKQSLPQGIPEPPECLYPRLRVPNFGLSPEKISRREKTTYGGQEISKEEGIQRLIREQGLPDDSRKNFLVLVADNHQGLGKILESDLASAKELADWKEALRVKSYEADDAMIRDRDGQVMYPPGLWFVSADGQAAGQLPGYEGPAPLAEALRKLPSDWDPKKVPDLRKPNPNPWLPPLLPEVPQWVWTVGVILLVLLILKWGSDILGFLGRVLAAVWQVARTPEGTAAPPPSAPPNETNELLREMLRRLPPFSVPKEGGTGP
jgi:hypothetical protein